MKRSCHECSLPNGRHEEWCSIGRNWSPEVTKRGNRTGCFRPLLIVLAIAFALTACSATITRPEVHQTQASHTSTGQDSGILGESKDAGGFIVNQDWIDGWDSLLATYGKTLSPPREKGDRNGILKDGDHYRISDAVLERHLFMNARRVNDQKP